MKTGHDMQRLLQGNRTLFAGALSKAREVKDRIDAASPLLESITAAVCPACKCVCCISRHSRYDRSDMIYMASLGHDIPEYRPDIEETAPCRFLERTGCKLERSLRPYRCTWYFCTPLLEHIVVTQGPVGYRHFVNLLQQLTEKRMAMINDFEAAFHELRSATAGPE